MFTLWYLFRVYYFNVYIPRKNFMKERRNACFGVAQVKGNSWNVFFHPVPGVFDSSFSKYEEKCNEYYT